MEKLNKKSNLGIIVPTIDRPDFVIRQLNYYAKLKSPHTLYYADSSNPENAKKITDEIARLKDKLHIVYIPSPVGDILKSIINMLSLVQEKYVAYAGDDDYWVPDVLNQCAEFLEKNPDYEAATGKSIMFKLQNMGAYGEIKVIYDYPKYPIENNTASERLFTYLGPKPSTIAAAVVRKDHFLKYHQDSLEIKDFGIRAEFLISCSMVIAGKYKVIDELGYIMQLHNADIHVQKVTFDTYDWVIANSDWYSSYVMLKKKVVDALIAKDGISEEKAGQVFKQSMWFWMKENLSSSYDRIIEIRHKNVVNPQRKIKRDIKKRMGAYFPILKSVYKKYITPITKKSQLEYQVTRPSSRYYANFKPIMDSLNKI